MIIDIDSIYSFQQLGQRENQEDARFPDIDNPATDNATFVVCDGVGGCEKGEVASATVCGIIGKMLSGHKNTDDFSDEDFRLVLSNAYKALDEVSDESNRGMGTTLTFVTIHSDGILAAHIGDSRIYQIRPGEGIIYRSEDHSLVNALLRSGNISPDDIKDHPKANIITRCMSANDGVRDNDDATVINLQNIATGDYLLLCTDGVIGKVDDEELIELYNADKTDEDKCKYLAAKCINSADNNTAIQIHVGIVTIGPQEDSEGELLVEGQEIVKTAKIESKEESVHELSPISAKTQSKLKSFFNRLFK
jgi:protein phosphatase